MDTELLIDYFRPVIDMFGDHPYLRAVVALVIAFAIANILAFIISKIVAKLVQKTGNRLDDQITKHLRTPVYWTIILVGVLMAIVLAKMPPSLTEFIRSATLSILIMIWSVFLIRTLRLFIKAVSDRSDAHSIIRPQTQPLFNNIVLVVVLALSVYLVFSTWHIDMTAWLASAGIIGIAVGFAAKDTLANLFAGVFILADTPYKIGDYVVLDTGERGKVTHIGIRSTRILTRDDVEITIPNSIMGNTRVTNQSGGPHEKFRTRVPVGVAYGSDIDQVRRVLLEIATQEPEVCKDPEPRVRFRKFGASSLDFELLCWVDNPEFRGRVVDALNSTIYKRFKVEGIEIPYSKHDVFIKELPRAFTATPDDKSDSDKD
jgi:small-conductance mechanosensitive channel